MQVFKKIDGFLVIIAVLIGVLIYGGYEYYTLKEEKVVLEGDISNLEEKLDEEKRENRELSEAFYTEQSKNEFFQNQIEDLEDVVGDLDKLSKTDPELLQKYSKVYFLNEHYRPEKMEKIDQKWVVKDEEEYIHEKVWPFLEDLLKDARRDGIDLRIISAFRSFDEQKDLKTQYSVTYGTGANRFSAEQGYSEHQLGTTVDFSTEELGVNYTSLDQTEAFEWLENNAHKYGFILSYPKENEYYQYEPWHWRFVGEKLAEDLDEEKEYFYDWDQREINKYLIDLFD